MGKYTAPITLYEGSIVDRDGYILIDDDIARDLTEFYALKAKQEECGKTGHLRLRDNEKNCDYPVCVKCGKDLRGNA